MKHRSKRLLDRVRDAIRLEGYSVRTEEAYADWIKRFILFHGKRHPQEMGYSDVRAFLLHLATEETVAASTHNQALNGLLFLYREVLGKDLDGPIKAIRLVQELLGHKDCPATASTRGGARGGEPAEGT